MAKLKFNKHLNRDRTYDKEKKSNRPSLSMPGLALSVTEEIKRIRRNVPVSANHRMVFDEMDAMPDIRKMDLVEQREMLNNVRDEVKALTDKGKAYDKEQRRLQDEKLAAAELEKETRLIEKLSKQKGGQ